MKKKLKMEVTLFVIFPSKDKLALNLPFMAILTDKLHAPSKQVLLFLSQYAHSWNLEKKKDKSFHHGCHTHYTVDNNLKGMSLYIMKVDAIHHSGNRC